MRPNSTPIATLIAVLFTGVFLAAPVLAADRDTAIHYGNPDAAVVIVELTDYECPFCKSLHPHLLEWVAEHDQVRLAVREVAIVNGMSEFAAKAALAAANQNKRRPFHEALMAYKGGLSPDVVLTMAAEAGMDLDRLLDDMSREKEHFSQILADNLKMGLKKQMRGTPSFLINDRLHQTSNLDEIKAAVQEALAVR